MDDQHSIKASVVNVHTLRPLDKNINHLISKFPLVVTVEEHFISGGLGTIISELASFASSSHKKTQVIKLGLPNEFLKSGTYEQLLQRYNLTPDKIVKDIYSDLENYKFDMNENTFKALVVRKRNSSFSYQIETREIKDLPQGIY